MERGVDKPWQGTVGLRFPPIGPPLPLASADLVSRVQLTDAGALADSDLGVTVGAVSPDGKDVLIGGMNGYARLLSAEEADNREMDIELVTGKNATVHDIAWHPRGNTALLMGEQGLAMRYDTYDHSVTNVNGSFSVLGQALTTVVWRPAGDFAYVGSVDGSVWKFAEHTGFELLDNLGSSEIMDISCHRNYNVCFVASKDDGIAVIDEGHALSWIAQTAAETWVGIDCADPTLNECVGFASGLVSKGHSHQHHRCEQVRRRRSVASGTSLRGAYRRHERARRHQSGSSRTVGTRSPQATFG